MGLIADAMGTLARVIPERKVAVGATVPTWESGMAQNPPGTFWRFGKEGYSQNEVIYAAIEELCTSAAEPRIAAMAKGDDGPEKIDDHPVLALLERPNPFLDRFAFWATVILHLMVGGNAYIEKVRSASGKVVELWLLRPDRVWVIPDARSYIGGYEYRISEQTHRLAAQDIIHVKMRNPISDYYGLPPLAVAAARTDVDNFMRSFVSAFFRNAGVPAGLLNVTKSVGVTERQMIRDRFRNETGGPGGWHSLLVLDNTEATYTAMGMPLGERGLVMPDLDEINEVRLAMVFGVPLELIGARIGMIHGNRSTTKEARASFWDETLAPLYQMLGAAITTGLHPEYGDFDYLEFDLSTVKALQEDQDSKHTRIREDVKAGLLSIQEGRAELGKDPEYDKDAILMLPDNLSPVLASEMLAPPAPAQPALTSGHQNGANGNGAMTERDVAALALLRNGSGR